MWDLGDIRIVGDVLIGSLLASSIRLIVTKAFLEPLAVWTGRSLYRRADSLSGGVLPNWIPSERNKEV